MFSSPMPLPPCYFSEIVSSPCVFLPHARVHCDHTRLLFRESFKSNASPFGSLFLVVVISSSSASKDPSRRHVALSSPKFFLLDLFSPLSCSTPVSFSPSREWHMPTPHLSAACLFRFSIMSLLNCDDLFLHAFPHPNTCLNSPNFF